MGPTVIYGRRPWYIQSKKVFGIDIEVGNAGYYWIILVVCPLAVIVPLSVWEDNGIVLVPKNVTTVVQIEVLFCGNSIRIGTWEDNFQAIIGDTPVDVLIKALGI